MQDKPDQPIRVRIAPSPTGALHFGTARTALFNLLFARKKNGVFILRIEDTDRDRSSEAFEHDILEQLRWLGIQWDEGPDVGGGAGPYRQSERSAIYERYLKQLLSLEKAYYCLCSPEQLQEERDRQQHAQEPLRYSGACRSLSFDEAQSRITKGERGVIRLRVAEATIMFDDLVRGTIEFQASVFGDFAIGKVARDEIFALYNFAVVIDDALMQISHVLRGEDHIANTPKQILLAGALGFSLPRFGHLPLVLASDRSKLSKRHGAMSVHELRELGYFPEALVNFFALLGWNPGTEQEIFSLDELFRVFDLERVQKGGAIWNQDKLEWLNKEYYKQKKFFPEELFVRVEKVLQEKGWKASRQSLERIIALVLERGRLLGLEQMLVVEHAYFFDAPRPSPDLLRWKESSDQETREALHRAVEVLTAVSDVNWKEEALRALLINEAAEWGRGDRGKLLWPLRVGLTGQRQSPAPFSVAAVLGKEETLRRLGAVMEE